MNTFFQTWGEAAMTSLGFFWMALWAFALGYTISSMIQVFVTQERMQRTMGDDGPRAMALGTFFGFISSSCSFAALSTVRAIFQKVAGLAPALAFLLASTNLVIELGILIFIFLAWQFVLGEYLGGLLLIGVMWVLVRFTLPKRLADAAREHAREAGGHGEDGDAPNWRELVRSREGWRRVGSRYFMEWGMVWKDVTFGFTVAGVIAAFVPPSFFQALFVGSGPGSDPAWWQIALHTLVGPVAAFFTFIGSMGNIPLAAILFGSGVSFAGGHGVHFLRSRCVPGAPDQRPVLRVEDGGLHPWCVPRQPRRHLPCPALRLRPARDHAGPVHGQGHADGAR